eukprot:XP_014783819.1 PREDICTED: short-chain collagen C4-like isoform X2 [Octopus bimaculoides]
MHCFLFNFTEAGHGSLYTRWGRKTCPDTAELVYEGVVGGQSYKVIGGGSNLLCLPKDPIPAEFTSKVEAAASIYGAEYQLEAYTSDSLFSFENAKELHDHNVPCAVCLTREPAIVMMLPARTVCYSDWKTEYSGYLMAEANKHNGRNEYVCVDYAPETIAASNASEDAALLYFVQTVCGSLPWSYINGLELTCVVCTKY